MVVLKLPLPVQPHHFQGCTHRPLARRQQCADDQYLHQVPDAPAKQLLERGQQAIISSGRISMVLSLVGDNQLIVPFLFVLSTFVDHLDKVQQ